jgi:GntR family transcriptional regulator
LAGVIVDDPSLIASRYSADTLASMKTATQHILGAEPVMSKPGQPLRIAEYGRVAEAIVSGRALPGSMLPTEAEVGETLGVSRTVVREALMLLEEDQLITTRRGIGRFVALEPAKFGLERIAPFDELLRSAEPNRTFALSNLEAAVQDGTEFTARGLDVEDSTPTWFWEHIVTRDGRPVAILQEHVVATDEASDGFSEQRRRASAVATEMAGRASTLLSLIRKDLGPELGPEATGGDRVATDSRADPEDFAAGGGLLSREVPHRSRLRATRCAPGVGRLITTRQRRLSR